MSMSDASNDGGRLRRSRKDRPCDACRKTKHICILPHHGEPCIGCAARGKECTFTSVPTKRSRKPASASPAPSGQIAPSPQPNQAWSRPQPGPTTPAMTSSPSNSVFALISSLKEQQPSSSGLPPALEDGLNVSLDLQDTGTEEWQYVHPAPFSNWTLATEDPQGSSFRQVSSDKADPAFFCLNPALVYGPTGSDPSSYYRQACELVLPLLPAELIEIGLVKTLPAFPLADVGTLRRGLAHPQARSSNWYAILTAMLAHVTTYVPQIRPQHKQIWRQALMTVEDEYRRPRLQTISLALLMASSRPQIQLGQHGIATARAAGAAVLIGLHRDPAKWLIPKWEKSLRRRIWWCLLIHDKWRGLLHGRTSLIHRSTYNVSLPTLDDAEDRSMSADEVTSFNSFIAMCRLNEILDEFITIFQPERDPLPDRPTQLAHLENLGQQLANLEHSSPIILHISNTCSSAPLPTGVRSFQLSLLAMGTHLIKRTIEAIEPRLSSQRRAALRGAFDHCTTLVHFVECFKPEEMGGFFMQYSAHHLSICGALILRIAIQSKVTDPELSTRSCALITRFVSSLLMQHHSYHWDVASLGLDRIFRLLRAAEGDLPEVASLVAVFGPPNLSAEISAAQCDATPADPDPFGFAPDLFDTNPLWWLSTDSYNAPDGSGFDLSSWSAGLHAADAGPQPLPVDVGGLAGLSMAIDGRERGYL